MSQPVDEASFVTTKLKLMWSKYLDILHIVASALALISFFTGFDNLTSLYGALELKQMETVSLQAFIKRPVLVIIVITGFPLLSIIDTWLMVATYKTMCLLTFSSTPLLKSRVRHPLFHRFFLYVFLFPMVIGCNLFFQYVLFGSEYITGFFEQIIKIQFGSMGFISLMMLISSLLFTYIIVLCYTGNWDFVGDFVELEKVKIKAEGQRVKTKRLEIEADICDAEAKVAKQQAQTLELEKGLNETEDGTKENKELFAKMRESQANEKRAEAALSKFQRSLAKLTSKYERLKSGLEKTQNDLQQIKEELPGAQEVRR